MKANELMIGDFLRYKRNFPDTHLQGKIVKVCGVRGRVDVRTIDDGNFHESMHPDWLEPVRITPEILEKNGFDFIKNDNTKSVWNGWWIYEGLELATACLDKEGNWPCFINIYDSNIECEYIYQLQHALRLCGIEKEIEL